MNKKIDELLTLSQSGDIRYLHFGTEWVQSAVRLSNPVELTLEYAHYMMITWLWCDKPQRILQLGLGGGALTRFGYHFFPQTQINVVEWNPKVIEVCGTLFKIPRDSERLRIVNDDAANYVADKKNHACFDWIQIDLYDAQSEGPTLDSTEFYQNCAHCLTEAGVLSINLFGLADRIAHNQKNLQTVFEHCYFLPAISAGNQIALIFKTAPTIPIDTLKQRAKEIMEHSDLPTSGWMHALQNAKPHSYTANLIGK